MAPFYCNFFKARITPKRCDRWKSYAESLFWVTGYCLEMAFLFISDQLVGHSWSPSFQTTTENKANKMRKEGKTLVYDHSKSKFHTTITRIERGLMTWSDWMAHMGCDSTALNSTTVIFHIHYFYSTYCPISLQGIIVCNARNRLLSSRGIDKSLMVLVTSLIHLFNYTVLIRQN